MLDCSLHLSASERREIDYLARNATRTDGVAEPVDFDEMASALLSAHLVLIRDCGGILPGSSARPKGKLAKSGGIKRIRGVSLRDGINGTA